MFFLYCRVNSPNNSTNSQLPEGLVLLRRRRSPTTDGLHVIFKKSQAQLDSDYGKWFNIFIEQMLTTFIKTNEHIFSLK